MPVTQSRSEAVQFPIKLTSRARIIVISQFFGPDQSSVGQFLADFADSAAAAGHDVRVICGASDYAPTDISAPSSIQGRTPETLPERSTGGGTIRVVKVRTATFSQSRARKLLSYATFYAGASWRALWIPKPDVVLTLTAPPGLAWIGWLVQQIRGCRHVAWEMDVYPDVAIALDIPVAAWTSRMLDFPRRRANAVIVLGPCMKTRLLQHRIAEDRIIIAENWADGEAITPLPFPEQRPLRILYSGNLGQAHDVTTIRTVMERLANSPDLLFIFAGRRPRAQSVSRFLSGARDRECFFSGIRSVAGLGCEFGRGTRGPCYAEVIDRRHCRAEQDLRTDGGSEASPLHRSSGGHARPSRTTIRLRLALRLWR